MKITILEFAPCADTIYHFRRDADEGYIAGDSRSLTIKSGAKLRPQLVSAYAGGKATNVARIIDCLLNDDDEADIELVVFRPDSPEGRYIHDLQTSALRRVTVRPVLIGGQARFCIDLTDPATDSRDRVEFNISPRALWEPGAIDAALQTASALSSDALILAGNPPVVSGQSVEAEMAVDLYAQVIERVRSRVEVVSIDTEKTTLARCLESTSRPDVVKINAVEYASIDERLWADFSSALIVTDTEGCRLRCQGSDMRIRSARVDKLYSTIGAGDAVHAGFTLARWLRGLDFAQSARYGLAAAAVAVSSPEGTREISRQRVEEIFAEMEKNG
jgi:fructose-1-phosphate kinase PfkB-like protein